MNVYMWILLHPTLNSPSHNWCYKSVRNNWKQHHSHKFRHKPLLQRYIFDNILNMCEKWMCVYVLTHQPPQLSTSQRTCPQRSSSEGRAAGPCVSGWGLPLYPSGGSTSGSARRQTLLAKPLGNERCSANNRGKNASCTGHRKERIREQRTAVWQAVGLHTGHL